MPFSLHALSPGLASAWDRASPRERAMIVIAAVVLVLAAGWTWLWQPMKADIARLQRGPSARARRPRDRACASQRPGGAAAHVRARQSADPRAAVERVLAERGLRPAVAALDVQDGRVRLTFAAVRFDALIGLLDALARTDGVARRRRHARCRASSPAPCAPSSRSRGDVAMKSAAVAIVGFALLLGAIAAFAPASLVDRRLAAVSSASCAWPMPRAPSGTGPGILTDATGTWRVPVGWSVVAAGACAWRARRDAASRRRRDTARHDRHRRQRGHIARRRGRASRDGAGERAPGPRRDRAGRNRYARRTGIRVDGERGSGALNARWRDARLVVAGTNADLGTVDVRWNRRASSWRARIGNSGGDVRIDGTITIASTAIGVDATIAPVPSTPAPVLRALAALGTPDSAGAVRIAWRGSLR